jgi:predicted chitinase
MAFVAAVGVTLAAAAAATLPMTASDAAVACATAYSNSAVYTGGMQVSYNAHNWTAKWWTQYEAPSTGGSGVWQDNDACGGSTGGGGTSGFVASEAQFNQMFPSRNSFYTYAGLTDAMTRYPAFATTGGDTAKKQEAAAFLANVGHETGGLVYINEINTANWPLYCDLSPSYGCPAGQSAYHGRGPIQLSWNFNYKAAGDALGVDLLHQPDLVATSSSVSWQTGLWYWMTGTGNAGTTSHNALVNGNGFGTTIRAINSIECNGGNPAEMQDRVNLYNQFVGILGVGAGGNLTC